ncbi:hypothetical protein [Nocardioides litoris]|uniref:hypothetical protein n=1 Tax=Nocardioides litoris TaxID=1926648 RepID=UPI00112366A6|nr:hypothetical protein [Nocardioides litoris]
MSEPRRPVAKVAVAGLGALEIVVDGVGQTVARTYAGVRRALEPLRDGIAATYDTDEVEVHLADGDDPIGRHGHQRLVDAHRFVTSLPAPPEDPWRHAERDEEVVLTHAAEKNWVGVYVRRDYDGQPGTQVVHLSPAQAQWLLDALRRHPGLRAAGVPDLDTPVDADAAKQREDQAIDDLFRDAERRELVQARMIANLRSLWDAWPEQRLSQLLVNVQHRDRPDTEPDRERYYATDEHLDAALADAIAALL